MKRKSIISLLCLMMVTCFLAGCDMLGKEPHVHTFDTVWTHDATSHWYEATCDCEDVEVVKANHVDENNDSLCDVCKYDYDHTHTFQTENDWTVDCTNHWRAATCDHLVAAQGVEAHADANDDGKCDTCKYMIKDIHEHVYADGWTTDADNHWHAAICEHKAETSGKEAHSVNAAGECTVCGVEVEKIDATDFAAVLEAANVKSYMVIDGKVAYENTVYDGTAGAYTVGNWTEQDIYYVIGDKAAYRTETITNASGTTIDQYWFELANDEDTSLFCLYLQGGTTELTMLDGPLYALNGYSYYPGSVLKELDYPKLEEAIKGLYDILVANVHVSEAESAFNSETGVYSFSYTYFTVNATSGSATPGGTGTDTTDGDTSGNTMSYEAELYEVAVEFTVDANKVINWADFSVNVYRDTALDDDINYDPETDTVSMNAGANPTVYAYVVTQTSGERTYTTPYPKASVVPTDFELLYVTETARDDNANRYPVATVAIENNALTLEAGVSQLLAIGDVYPVSSNPAFFNGDDIQVSMVSKDDSSVTCYAYYSWQYMTIGFYSKPGNWTLTITCGEIVKVVDVTVNPAKATSISAQVFVWETDYWGGKNYAASSASTITVEAGTAVDFTAVVSPDAASQEFTYTLDNTTDASITEVTLENVTVNYSYYKSYEAYQFKSDVVGTYVITVKDKDDLKSATLTITVIPAPIVLEVGDNEVEVSAETLAAYEPVMAEFTATADGYYTFAGDIVTANVFMADGSTVIAAGAALLEAGDYVIQIPVWNLREAGVYDLPITYTATEDMTEDQWKTLLDSKSFSFDGYNVYFSKDADTGVYYLNAYDSNLWTWDQYFTYTVTVNEDGSLTLDPTLAEHSAATGEDVLGVADMTFTATYVDGTWKLASSADVEDEGEVVVDITGTYTGTSTNGELTIEITADTISTMVGTTAVSYTYTIEESVVTLYNANGAIDPNMALYFGGLTLGEDGMPTEFLYNGYTYDLVKAEAEAVDITGTYTGTSTNGELTIEITADTISTMVGTTAVSYTYTIEEGVVTLYNANGAIDPNMALYFGGLTLGEDGMPTEFLYNGYTYDLVKVTESEGGEDDTTEVVSGTISVTTTDTNGYIDEYTFTAPVAGTYTFTVPAGLGMYSKTAYDAWEAAEVDFNSNTSGATYSVTLAADEAYVFYVGATTKADWEISYTTATSSEGGEEESKVLVLGENAITVTDDDLTNGAIDYTIVVENEGMYEFASNNLMAVINFADGTTQRGTAYLTAGTYTINVVTAYLSAAGDYTMTITYTAPEGEEDDTTEVISGTISVTTTDTNGYIDEYTFTAPVAGTYTFTVPAGLGMYSKTAYDAWEAAEVDFNSNTSGATYSVTLAADEAFVFYVGATTKADWEISYTTATSSEGGDDSGEEESKVLVLGENAITVTDDDLTNGAIDYTIVVENEGTYEFASNSLMAVINLADGSTQRGTAYLTAGTYTINVVTAYLSTAGDYTMTITYTAPESEDGENSGETGAGDGSSSNPYVIESLPFEVTFESAHDKYYTYTATEDCTIVITCPAGCLVSETGATKGDDGNYTVSVTAGQVLRINPWSNGGTAPYTYKISKVEAVEPNPGEGEEGGETTSVVTYMSAEHGSGRYLKVEIDAAAGTMTLTRSNMSGGWDASTSTATYTYVANGADSTATLVSGQSCTFTWNADGTPSKITWGSAVFEGFTVQA